MEGLAARDRLAAAVGQRVDQLSKQMQTLNAQADDLAAQADRARLAAGIARPGRRAREEDRVAVREPEAEPPGSRYAAQGDPGLLQVARRGRRSCAIGSRPTAPRSKAFLERTTAFSAGLPELEARMDAITSKLAIVDEGTQKAAEPGVDRRRSRSPDDAHRDAAAVRRARRGAAEHAERPDRRSRPEARRADRAPRRGRSAPQPDRRRRHPGDRRAPEARGGERHPEQAAAADRAALDAQEPDREGARAVRRGAEGRGGRWPSRRSASPRCWSQTRRRRERGGRAAEAGAGAGRGSGPHRPRSRTSWCRSSRRVQARQRDVGTQMEAADDQLKRLEATSKQLEQRRSPARVRREAHRRVRGAPRRPAADDRGDREQDPERSRSAKRSSTPSARKSRAVHEISARSKSDLQYVEAHRSDVASLRERVDERPRVRSARPRARLAQIESRKRLVDEVQLKTNVIVNMLEDVRLNMETLGEHKARDGSRDGRTSTGWARWCRRRSRRCGRCRPSASWPSASSAGSSSCARRRRGKIRNGLRSAPRVKL